MVFSLYFVIHVIYIILCYSCCLHFTYLFMFFTSRTHSYYINYTQLSMLFTLNILIHVIFIAFTYSRHLHVIYTTLLELTVIASAVGSTTGRINSCHIISYHILHLLMHVVYNTLNLDAGCQHFNPWIFVSLYSDAYLQYKDGVQKQKYVIFTIFLTIIYIYLLHLNQSYFNIAFTTCYMVLPIIKKLE